MEGWRSGADIGHHVALDKKGLLMEERKEEGEWERLPLISSFGCPMDSEWIIPGWGLSSMSG
jgi:hypothetical protein